MSVNPQMVPDWSRHRLAEDHKGVVRGQANRLGLCQDDADEEAERQALRLCLEGVSAGTPEEVRIKFLQRTKYGLIHRRELLRMEKPMADFRAAFDDGEEASDDVMLGVFARSVAPTQIEDVFAKECFGFIDLLPHNHRRVMRKLATGYSPVEIAEEERANLLDILREIKVARDWMVDHVKYGA